MKQKCHHGYIDNENGFVSSIVQSIDIVNATHIDLNDSTESIVRWTESKLGEAKGWYFIMINITRDGTRAVVIERRHGVTIK